ncbi:MAG: C40 family peptidase [Campylobacterales bacterium]|nr:C40 family peptidase [Campylobacterales bacterium]
MQVLKISFMIACSLLFFSACSQKHSKIDPNNPFPKHPRYAIFKPEKTQSANYINLAKTITELQGRHYVWAEEGPECFDCSGYTYYAFGKMGIEIPRVARDQIKEGKVIKISDLQFGDLIFFDTTPRKTGKITHVGIYLGDGKFTHASTTDYKITVGDLNENEYYKKRFKGARRYLNAPKDSLYLASLREIKSKLSSKDRHPVMLAINNQTPNAKLRVYPQDIYLASNDMIKISDKSTSEYYVQLGLFTNEPKKNLLNKISKEGHRYTLLPSDAYKNSKKLLIGPFKDKSEADKTLISIRAKIVKEAFVTKLSS